MKSIREGKYYYIAQSYRGRYVVVRKEDKALFYSTYSKLLAMDNFNMLEESEKKVQP